MNAKTAKNVSYIFFASVIVLTIVLRIGQVVLAGCLSYMILDLSHRQLGKRMNHFLARWISVLVFILTTFVIGGLFASFMRLSFVRLPVILSDSIPKVVNLAAQYSIDLPFDNPEEFRALVISTVKENAHSITLESEVLTKGFFHILLVVFVAVLHFLEWEQKPAKSSLYSFLYEGLGERVRLFMDGFEKVIAAQLVITIINTLMTAVLLLVFHLPFFKFLTLSTFMFGFLPIIGNLISNCLIAGTALMISPQHAFVILLALALLHKAEYLVNSHIVSSRVDLPTWQILLGILIGEILLGIPGIILAPAVITYIRKETESVEIPA